jgi:hypothetical protein
VSTSACTGPPTFSAGPRWRPRCWPSGACFASPGSHRDPARTPLKVPARSPTQPSTRNRHQTRCTPSPPKGPSAVAQLPRTPGLIPTENETGNVSTVLDRVQAVQLPDREHLARGTGLPPHHRSPRHVHRPNARRSKMSARIVTEAVTRVLVWGWNELRRRCGSATATRAPNNNEHGQQSPSHVAA